MRSLIDPTYSDFATFRRAIVVVGGSATVGFALGVHCAVANRFPAFIASQSVALVSSGGVSSGGLRTRSSGAEKMVRTPKSQVASRASDAWDKSSRVGEQPWRLLVGCGVVAKNGTAEEWQTRSENQIVLRFASEGICSRTAVGAMPA